MEKIYNGFVILIFLFLLVFATNAHAQTNIMPIDSVVLPVHSYIIGLTIDESKILVHTIQEAWERPTYGMESWLKLFDLSIELTLTIESSVATNATTSNHYFYTGGIFGPTLYDYQRLPPASTESFLPYFDSPAALLSTSAGVYLVPPSGDGGGIDFFENPADTETPTLSFAAGINFGALALSSADSLLYALDVANNRIVRYDTSDGSYAGEFSVPSGIAGNSFAISDSGLLFLADFNNGAGYIYNASTGTQTGTFTVTVDINTPGNDGKPCLLTSADTLWITSGSGLKIYKYNFSTVPLPVELVSFTASAKNNFVELNWNTATEVNNFGFEVERTAGSGHSERSEESRAWTKLGFVEGNRTTNSPKNYLFVDKNIFNGKYSYRLKQIDRDGKFEYSKSIEVEVNNTPKVFSLEQNYPNPFNPTTTIAYNVPRDSKIKVTVFDMLGREIATLVDAQKSPGRYEIKFVAGDLSSGIYFYRLQAEDFIQTKKLVLMK